MSVFFMKFRLVVDGFRFGCFARWLSFNFEFLILFILLLYDFCLIESL